MPGKFRLPNVVIYDGKCYNEGHDTLYNDLGEYIGYDDFNYLMIYKSNNFDAINVYIENKYITFYESECGQ